MTSKGWIKLKNFRIPLYYKMKLKLANYIFMGKIKTRYYCKDDTTLIEAKFNGDKLPLVLNELSKLLKKWKGS